MLQHQHHAALDQPAPAVCLSGTKGGEVTTDVRTQRLRGSNPAHVAARSSKSVARSTELTRTRLLLGQAEREWGSRQPEYALGKAARAGDAGLVRRLLAARPDLRDEKDGCGETPLMWAADNGHPEVVEVLVDGGAQLDLQNSGGRTALWNAAYGDHPAVVRLLVDRGADQTITGWSDRTPREIAVEKGHAECAALLRCAAPLLAPALFDGVCE